MGRRSTSFLWGRGASLGWELTGLSTFPSRGPVAILQGKHSLRKYVPSPRLRAAWTFVRAPAGHRVEGRPRLPKLPGTDYQTAGITVRDGTKKPRAEPSRDQKAGAVKRIKLFVDRGREYLLLLLSFIYYN